MISLEVGSVGMTNCRKYKGEQFEVVAVSEAVRVTMEINIEGEKRDGQTEQIITRKQLV